MIYQVLHQGIGNNVINTPVIKKNLTVTCYLHLPYNFCRSLNLNPHSAFNRPESS